MLYRIESATARSNLTVSVAWSDGVAAVIDFASIVAKGKVFAPLQDPGYFVGRMRVLEDHLGLEWPDRVDFSADGLRFRAFPNEADEEFGGHAAEAPA